MGFSGKCFVFGILFLAIAFIITLGILSSLNPMMMLVGTFAAGIMGFLGFLLVFIGFLARVWKR